MRPSRTLLVTILSSFCAAVLPAHASPSGVVISGFQVRGPAGGNDEYIELRNAGTANVDISGWKLQGCAAGSGAASNRATVNAGVVLTPGQHYLFTNSGASGYSGAVPGDQTYATGVTDFTNAAGSAQPGIQLLDAANLRQDGVGSPQSPCREGTGILTPTANGANDAFARTQDTDNNAADFSGPGPTNPHNSGGITVTCTNSGVHIYTIQGRGHISPLNGQRVCEVPGVVTQVVSTGFYMQDGDGDGDVTTSDGIFVFTASAPPAVSAVGAVVSVAGTVNEFRPGSTFGATNCPSSAGACNLTVTEIDGPTVTAAPANTFTNTVITPVMIGNGGRIPPNERIDDNTAGSVEVAAQTTYDPANDGIDFYESLEGMQVQINGARVVGPTNSFGEIWLVGDNGANATGVNARGGVTLIDHGSYVDYNPERVMIDTSLATSSFPQANVGDTVAAPIVGAMSYDFGNFRVFPTALPTFAATGPARTASTVSGGPDRLRIASYNVENLDANDADTCDGAPDMDVANGRFTREAQQIVGALGSPDIMGIEELQDNSGCVDNGVVDSSTTLNTLIAAIVAAGGPTYSYQIVNPVDDQDGGVPGGNIRQAVLYNAARVAFVPGTTGAGDSVTPTAVSKDANGRIQLTLSPGRIDPNNAAWNASRKPLAATFDFNGHRILVIVNHFDSKGGDEPLFGRFQPPVLSSAVQRVQQAQIEHDFVQQALSLDSNALVVTLGDFNDFDFSDPMRTLTGAASGTPILADLATALLAPPERYSYVFEGNSQELDHIYVTTGLVPGAQFQPIHVNSEYADQVSDHDPMIASLLLPVPDTTPPVTNALASPPPNAQGFNTTPVTITFTATDNTGGSGVNSIQYSLSGAQTGSGSVPSGGSVTITAEGQTTVTYFATDNAGNAEAPHTLVVRIDHTAPVLTLPASLSVDATTPAGAVVNFTATATDNSGVAPPVSCTPASGSTFAIGTQTVTCTATDAAGNTATGSFTVTVRGVPEQTAALIAAVLALRNVDLPPGVLNGLATALQNVLANAHSQAPFCALLGNFAKDLTRLSGHGIPAVQAQPLIDAANRIKAVEGCR